MGGGSRVRRSLAAAIGILAIAYPAMTTRSEARGDAPQASSGVSMDPYGGVAGGVAPATGYFQVKQVGGRWMFVTPDGNGMWLTGAFGVTYVDTIDDFGTSTLDRVVTKYGGGDGWRNNWRINTARRLKGWGFNTLSAYHHWAMRPGPLSDPNPEKMPYIHIINPARTALWNGYGLGTGPVKDLIVATDPRYYDGYRGAQSLDFFDPNFESYIDGWMRGDDGLQYGNIGNPWMLGIAMDEGDSLLGFGPGAEIPAPRLHPHLGWIAMVANFEQASSPWVTSYADHKVYTKYALRDFLAGKYGTIEALDAAWGSNYTTFDSAGGWGVGTGLLDENGRNPWVGYWGDEMATANPRAHGDLDEFLYFYAKRYFTVMAAKMRQYAPMHLVFGPTSLNGWAGLTRKEILRAAGESVDVLQAAIGSQQILDLTVKYAGNKPIVTWDSFVANPDSAMWRYPNPEDITPPRTRLALTQEGRGQLYEEKVAFLFNAVNSAGMHPVAGMTFWGWSDHWGEKANFGLVTLSDNAYDGKEAVVAAGQDAAGWPTGGEERSYGDFLSSVAAAHAMVVQSLVGATLVSSPAMYVDGPANGASVPGTFGVGGWAFDAGAGIAPGVDLVRIFLGTNCSGTVLADATLGGSRPDVQAVLGLPAGFGSTGFAGTVSLPTRGVQQITVCARSTVTRAFAASMTRSVAVSDARMNIDGPTDGTGVTQPFAVGGWAFDALAAVGPGVDLVRIFQGATCSGTVLAETVPGMARPDVQAALGLPAGFGNTGFAARVMLPSGGLQQITVCGRSTVAGAFMGVTHSHTVSGERMNVDGPANGAQLPQTFSVGGWAFDALAPTGPGVDLVRVFAGTGCTGTALADATTGIARPDVRTVFGLPEGFNNTGYSARVTLPGDGTQTFTVCGRSTLRGTFTQSLSRTVNVGG
jgi:hypothetical protein